MSDILTQAKENIPDLRAVNFFHLAEQLNAGLVLTSPSLEKPDPRIVYVNRTVQTITGYTAEELLGQSPRIFQGEQTNRQMTEALKEALREGKSFKGETVNYRKDGSPYEVELNVSPIPGADGEPLFFLGIQYDISAKRAAERAFLEAEQLQLALDAEKELNSMKANFISHFTEHMRQPLTVIRVAAELLERHRNQIAEMRIHSRLRLIMNEVDYLATTLDEIRLATNGFEPKPVLHNQNVEIRMMIEDIIDHLKESYPEREFIFEPSKLIPRNLYLDGRLVRIILQHIFSNAAKFSARGAKIRIRLCDLPDAIEIRVMDNGIGIPKESQAQLFNQYFRAPNAISYKGVGLGLVIVKKNIELLGGSISISSQENLGTQVSIRLPKEFQS